MLNIIRSVIMITILFSLAACAGNQKSFDANSGKATDDKSEGYWR